MLKRLLLIISAYLVLALPVSAQNVWYGGKELSQVGHTQNAASITDFSSVARGLISSSAVGLTYNNSTGVFSFTENYSIPLTADTAKGVTAHGWGDHASGGYFVKASDTLDNITAGSTNVHLTSSLKTNYDTAYTHSGVTTGNPHQVSKTDVGLGNCDNTSDANKPVSTATQTALNAKVAGPASSTDNAIARFDAETGKIIQNSSGILDDSGNLTVSSLISPDIKALLATHNFQYVYSWSALPLGANHKWAFTGTGDYNITDEVGSLSINDVAAGAINVLFYREAGTVLPDDVVIAEVRAKWMSATTADSPIIMVTENYDSGGSLYKSAMLSWGTSSASVYFNGVEYAVADTSVYHTYTVVKNGTVSASFYVDGQLYANVPYASLVGRISTYGTGRNIVFGSSLSSSAALCQFRMMWFKYSIIKESNRQIIGNSAKYVAGNIEVKDQAETSGISISPTAITSTGTNQNLYLTPNGAGSVVISKVDADSGTIDGTTIGATSPTTGVFTTATATTLVGAHRGVYQSVSTNDTVAANAGIVSVSTSGGTVALTVPDASANLGRRIIVFHSAGGVNALTVTMVTSTDRFLTTATNTLNTTATSAAALGYLEIQAAYPGRWRIVTIEDMTLSGP